MNRISLAILALCCLTALSSAQTPIFLHTADGATLSANLYGNGKHGLVLAHGGRRTKEDWAKQAPAFVAAGFRVLAFDFRGFGQSKGPGQADMFTAPLYQDVLAAVHYLRSNGAESVDVIGASFGGSASATACLKAKPGEIRRLVLLAATPDDPAALRLPKLFIIARDDTNSDGPRLPGFQAAFDKAPQPKEEVIVDGNAHAQFLFPTDQGDRVLQAIVRFLSAP